MGSESIQFNSIFIIHPFIKYLQGRNTLIKEKKKEKKKDN